MMYNGTRSDSKIQRWRQWIINATFLVASCAAAGAQIRAPVGAPATLKTSAEGTITVTLTVVTSVGLVPGPNGEMKLVIANAADPADNVSTVTLIKETPAPAPPQSQRPKHKKDTQKKGGSA